jgi:hypothetical protein
MLVTQVAEKYSILGFSAQFHLRVKNSTLAYNFFGRSDIWPSDRGIFHYGRRHQRPCVVAAGPGAVAAANTSPAPMLLFTTGGLLAVPPGWRCWPTGCSWRRRVLQPVAGHDGHGCFGSRFFYKTANDE